MLTVEQFLIQVRDSTTEYREASVQEVAALIDAGHIVQIFAPTGNLFDLTHRTILLLGKKHKYNIGLPSVSTVPEHGGKYSQVIVHNHPQNPFVGNAQVLSQFNENYLTKFDHLP